MEESIEQRIAERVVALLEARKFTIEQRRWPEIMDIKTAAEYMCRTPTAVRNLIQIGALPTIKGDSRAQIRRVDIDQWAAGGVR